MLCQRRRNINQSLDRYERNSRSKTAARFFPNEREMGGAVGVGEMRLRTESSALLGREVEAEEGEKRRELGSLRVASDNNVLKGITDKKMLK